MMRRTHCFLLLLAYCSFACSAEPTLFDRIAPVLEAKCVACHKTEIHKSNLDLTTRESLIKGGDEAPDLVPGKPNDSPLYTLTIPQHGQKPEMPKKGEPLTADETNTLRDWIAAGAPWPNGVKLKDAARADKTFWSFQPLRQEPLTPVSGLPDSWRKNPIDAFIFAKLAEKKLTPNPPAAPRDFLRRATYDLLGLSPTPEELDAFEKACAQNREQAVESLIDRLLASPHYGEQWGRHWLDVIRFGESKGYEQNHIITNLWPFRDYVINSFNADKPFDRFIHEHLAGDVLGPGDKSVEIASAFLVAGPFDTVGNQDAAQAAQIRADQMDEMIRASSEAFLGLTMGCARCHDHKFDPITTKDYYAWYATFAGTVHGERSIATPKELADHAAKTKPLNDEKLKLITERDAINKAVAAWKNSNLKISTDEESARLDCLSKEIKRLDAELTKFPPPPNVWIGTHKFAAPPFNVFIGGNPQKKGDAVSPASLSVFEGAASSFHLEASAPESQRRLALAKWLTAPDNPLTPRVLANRVWHYHFGIGIVSTPSDFGYMGTRPTHPELLDWLAQNLVANGWRLKPLHRLIMTSQTYQQSAAFSEDAARADADSRLHWRFPPRRLSAEEIRDTMLSVADKLDKKMGGPGFRLYEYQQDNVATYVPLDRHGPETYRRAVYHHNARAARVDVMTDFDCPDPAFAEPRRASTVTPLQALTLMNHSFSVDMAQAFAERLQTSEPRTPVTGQIQRACLLAFSRPPSTEESAQAEALIAAHGLRAFCRALLNSNEFIYLK